MAIRMTPEAIAARVKIGRTVRIFMDIRGKSVADLMAVLHVSDQQVRDRLKGKCNIPAHELELLASFLDIAPGEFFRNPDDLVEHNSRWTDVLPDVALRTRESA